MADQPASSDSQALALRKAVEAIGSQSKTARLLGVTQGAVSRWLAEGRPLPAEHVLAVETASGISKHELRPDIYPLDPPVTAARDTLEPAR